MARKLKIEELTARKAQNLVKKANTPADVELMSVLDLIAETSNKGESLVRLEKGQQSVADELANRGFVVKDTGMVWHISWEKK